MKAPAISAAKPKRADAQRNYARILSAAKQVFAESGSEAAMEEIARVAEVGVGTLYRHFPTKQALLGELLAERFRVFGAEAERALETIEDPWEAFAGTLRANAEYASRDVALQDAMFRGEASWEPVAEPLAALRAAMTEIIERGKAAGAIRADFTVDDIPLMMCGVTSAMANAHPSGEPMDWRRHLELLLDGVRTR